MAHIGNNVALGGFVHCQFAFHDEHFDGHVGGNKFEAELVE
jgi:hypothetical protein